MKYFQLKYLPFYSIRLFPLKKKKKLIRLHIPLRKDNMSHVWYIHTYT